MRREGRILVPILAAVIIVLSQLAAFGWDGPENVLVVKDLNSAISCDIADYYITNRRIPTANVVALQIDRSRLTSNGEAISGADFRTYIRDPILAYLDANNLVDQIQYIVLTKGIPFKTFTDSDPDAKKSVDSLLAATNLVNPLQIVFTDANGNTLGTTYVNRYWRSEDTFTHEQFGGYIVTRLDGYTAADARALVDRAEGARPSPGYLLLDIDTSKGVGDPSLQPKWFLLPNDEFDPDYELRYPDYNADMLRASQILAGRSGVSVEIDQTGSFIGSVHALSGYVSWGSNDGNYSAATYNSLAFAPGGIAETAVSTSARTFLVTTGGQSLVADLIAQGASGVKGYCYEPYLDAVASPSVLFDLYTSGRTLGESYLAASRFVGWMDIVVGDPLCTFRAMPVRHEVTGILELEAFGGDSTRVPVTVEIRNPGQTSPLETHTVNLDATGRFWFTTTLEGTYDLAFKASHWLRKVLPAVQIE